MAKANKPKETNKKVAPKKKAGPSPDALIVKACESALAVLIELNIEYQLQSEINWCLGSYNNDRNPIGLYQMAERSLIVLKEEKAKKTKGVTPKLIGDIEKAIKAGM